MASSTDTVRRFNRSWTQRVGALDESFLGLDLPLGSARLLYEIGVEPGTVQRLRERLGLDSGYLSRLLRRLSDRGLVEVTADAADRRRRVVRLSPDGEQAWRELDRRSDAVAAGLLEPLTPRQRDRLTQALATADLLVRASTVRIEVVDPTSAEARTAVARYVAELGRRFPQGFEPGPDDPAPFTAPRGLFLLALSDGTPVACGGLQDLGERVAEVKRMWVDDEWRGAGLGSRLLRRLEDEAARRGHDVVRLDTNRALGEAVALYGRAGYREIDRYNDNPYAEAFFEKRLA